MSGEEEPFETMEEIKEPLDKDGQKSNNKLILIIIIGSIIFLAILIGIILFFALRGSDEAEPPLIKQGEINCEYEISDIENEIQLINQNYQNKQKITMFIDNKEVPFTNIYKFTSKKKYNIKFNLNEKNLDLKNMFKNISSLVKVEMITNSGIIINDIEGAFEDCDNLLELKIKGFNIDNAISFNKFLDNTKKLNTIEMSEINMNNVDDFSYMFANSNANTIKLNFNTSQLKNMSHMFYNCAKLTSLDISLNTSLVEDMSSMFAYCFSLDKLNLSNFDTKSLKNMFQMFYLCMSLK